MKLHGTGQKFTKTYDVSGKGCATAGVLRTSQLPPTPNLHKNRLTGPNQPWLALCYCGMSSSGTTVDQLHNRDAASFLNPGGKAVMQWA